MTGRLLVYVSAMGLLFGGRLCPADDRPEQFALWGQTAQGDPYLKAVNPAPKARVDPTTEEKTQGFVILARATAALLPLDAAVTPEDRCRQLTAADAPGQYGPLTFALVALEPLDLTLTVTDLHGPAGRIIPANHLDLRMVRAVSITAKGEDQAVPLLLESFDHVLVPAEGLQQFWITYYLPETAGPGDYRGEVVLADHGREKARLPIDLEVYPFKLIDPDADLYIDYSNPTNPAEGLRLSRELSDQRLHGMTTSTFDAPVTGAGELRSDDAASLLDLYQQAGFPNPRLYTSLYNRILAEWINTPDKSIGMWGPWFRYYPFSDTLDQRYVAAVRTLQDQMQRRKLTLILQVADESGSHPWTTEATQHYNDLIREQLPDVLRELTVGGGWALGRPEHDLWKNRIQLWTSNRWLPDQFALVRKNDPAARIGLYNMAGGGSVSGGLAAARAFFGFYNWKAQATGASQWVYSSTATPEFNYVWPAADTAQGPVPTLRWELVREGAKDRRYLATLEQRLGTRYDPAAQAARQYLQKIAAQIELGQNEYDPISGGRIPALSPDTYDLWRKALADQLKNLDVTLVH